jgi:hypothetical protein
MNLWKQKNFAALYASDLRKHFRVDVDEKILWGKANPQPEVPAGGNHGLFGWYRSSTPARTGEENYTRLRF